MDAEIAKAKCVYCGTELNPGARVCHACTRGQPDPRRAERFVIALCVIVLLSVIGGFGGYQIYQAHEFEKAVAEVEAGAIVAQTPMTHDQAKKYVQNIMTSANVSASDAAKVIRAFWGL
jgi:predicted nucleic acid-binding Zn ribbon protein